jgi:hypothetical protein
MGRVVQTLAAKDCALLYWTSGPQMKDAIDIVAAWGFDHKTIAFAWVKTTRSVERITHENFCRKKNYKTFYHKNCRHGEQRRILFSYRKPWRGTFARPSFWLECIRREAAGAVFHGLGVQIAPALGGA